MPTLHIAFGLSAAHSLREAIAVEHPDDRVAAFRDDLSFGPIASLDPRLRAAWIAEHLDFEWWDEATLLDGDFWASVEAWPSDRLAWFSRTSASEHANFLEFNERMAGRSFRMLDLTDTRVLTTHPSGQVGDAKPVVAVACLPAEAIRRHRLIDRWVIPSDAQRDSDRRRWQRLKSEGAAFRVVDGCELVSAAITYFDERLLASCVPEWMPMARPIGNALSALAANGTHQVGDLVLASRMFALIDAGVLEARGSLSSLRDTEIRLKDASSRSGD